MRLHAYVLAGDPAWIRQGIGSFYGLVDRIVVSYDADGLSWSGHPLSTEESLDRIAAADPDGKVVLHPGRFSNPDLMAMWQRRRSGRTHWMRHPKAPTGCCSWTRTRW